MIMSLKQKEIKFKPRIKLNHNTVTKKPWGQGCIVFVELAKMAENLPINFAKKTIAKVLPKNIERTAKIQLKQRQFAI